MDQDDKVLFTVSLYHWCNDGSVILLPALFPLLQGVFSLSYTDIGLLSGFGMLATILAQVMTGHVSDRGSSPQLLALGIGVLALGLLAIPLADSFVSLFLLVLIVRVGASFYHPIGISWLSMHFGRQGLDRAMGIQSAVGDVGVIFGMVSAGFLGVYLGWQVPFIVWAGLCLASVLLGLRLAPRETKDKVEESVPTRRVWREMAPFFAPIVASGAVYSITVNMGPLLLTNMYGLGADVADVVIGLWIGAGALAAYLYSHYGPRAGRKLVLIGSYLVLTASGLLVYVLDDVLFVSIFLVASGASLLLSYPAMFSLFSSAVGRGARGRAFGIFFALNLSGAAAASYASGWTADLFSIKEPFLIVVGIALMTTLCSMIMLDERPRNT